MPNGYRRYQTRVKAIGHWFFCQSLVAKLFCSRVLGVLLPSLVGMYYVTLSLWAEKWDILRNYLDAHSAIYCLLIVCSLIALSWRALAEMFSEGRQSEYTSILEKLLMVIGKIVNQKCDRFQAKLRDLKPTMNPFDVITQPEEQIRYILREAQHFFADMIGIKPEAVDAFVVRRDPYKCKWHYVANTTPGRPARKPEQFVQADSLVKTCLESGEDIFVASKQQANDKKMYLFCEKDKQYNDIGSAFCSPLQIETEPENEEPTQIFVAAFVTYGAQICEGFDSEAIESAETLFREFVRRIEVECTLLALKTWRIHHQEQGKRNRNNSGIRKGG